MEPAVQYFVSSDPRVPTAPQQMLRSSIFPALRAQTASMKLSLTFLEDLELYREEKPYELWLPQWQELPENVPSTNCKFIEQSGIPLTNVRSLDCNLGLKDAGFQFLKDAAESDLQSEHIMQGSSPVFEKYLHHTIKLVQEETGADKVICFDWRVETSLVPP
jgi:hypothetical protein